MTAFYREPYHSKTANHHNPLVKMQRPPPPPPPQVNLTMTSSHGVPILETGPIHLPHHHRSTSTNTSTLSWPGQMLSRVTNMLRSPPSLHWVNRHFVSDVPPHLYNSPTSTFALPLPEEGPLWHSAPPGGIDWQMVMTDPQNIISYSLLPTKIEETMNTKPVCPKYKKALNPYAQEWLPKEYVTTTSSTIFYNGYTLSTSANKSSTIVTPSATVQAPVISSNMNTSSDKRQYQQQLINTSKTPPIPIITSSFETQNGGSHEISQNNFDNRSLSNIPYDLKISPEKRASLSESLHQNNLDFEIIPHVQSSENTSKGKKQSINSIHQSTQTDTLNNNINNSCNKYKNNNNNAPKINKQNSKEVFMYQESMSSKSPVSECQLTPVSSSSSAPVKPLSYAGVLGRISPPPLPPPPSQSSEVKKKGTQQPIPKIFQKDKPPQRDELTQVKEEGRRTCNLFRKPNKTQRTQSRKFLKELKATSNDACCPTSLLTASASFVPSSVCPSSKVTVISTPSIPIPNVYRAPDSPLSSLLINNSNNTPSPPTTTSQLNRLLSSQTNTSLVQDCTTTADDTLHVASTLASPNQSFSLTHESQSHVRSSSESSWASLDIEFVDKDEVDRALKVSPQSIRNATQSPKGMKNSFLACILGSVDSETEEEECKSDEDESDWDEVCEDSKTDLDDSWETFGFSLVVVSRHPVSTNQQCHQHKDTSFKEKDNNGLNDINKKWEQEIKKDVRGKSEPRVRFGDVKVYRMVVWDHAYRQARLGLWEQQARDRVRFAERVQSIEPILAKVLEPHHRQTVYEKMNSDPNSVH